MAQNWFSNYFSTFFARWFGGIGAPVPPTPGETIPAGGMRGKKRPEYGLVEYPERDLVFELLLRLVQRKPTFTAQLECYVVPEAEGKIQQTHKIQVSLGQGRARFASGLLQINDLSFSFVQGRQAFEANVFWAERKEKLPKWIEDIVNREKQEQDDEEAILAVLFGRKL